METLATEAEVAAYIGTTVEALAQRRYRGTGPKHIKMGRRNIRYRWADVEAWLCGIDAA